MTHERRRFATRHTAILAVASVTMVVAVAAGVGLAVAQTVHHSRPHRRSTRVLTKYYKVLRQAHAASAPSPAVQESLALAAAQTNFGLNSNDLQSVGLGSQGTLWIETGSSGICAVLDTQALNPVTGTDQEVAPTHCEPTNAALSDGLVATGKLGGTYIAWGLVPNGNSNVTIASASGPTQSVPVSENAFVQDRTNMATSVQFNDASGAATTIR